MKNRVMFSFVGLLAIGLSACANEKLGYYYRLVAPDSTSENCRAIDLYLGGKVFHVVGAASMYSYLSRDNISTVKAVCKDESGNITGESEARPHGTEIYLMSSEVATQEERELFAKTHKTKGIFPIIKFDSSF